MITYETKYVVTGIFQSSIQSKDLIPTTITLFMKLQGGEKKQAQHNTCFKGN